MARYKILFVEDEPGIREMYSIIHGKNHDVDIAEDGVMGLAKIIKNNYDVIVTDNNMPNKDGYDMLKEAYELGSRTPAIVVSAKPEWDPEIERFKSVPTVVGYFPKGTCKRQSELREQIEMHAKK